MALVGYRIPDNGVLVIGNPIIQILKVESTTDMVPGRWCVKGTNDDDVSSTDSPTGESAPAKVVGFLGWANGEPATDTPDTRDTAYATGAYASVLCGANFALMAVLSAVSGTKGELLTTGENGMLTGLVSPGDPGGVNANWAQTVAFAVLDATTDASTTITRAVCRSLI